MSLLKYSPKIDKTIIKIVEKDLKTKVSSANRIQAGEVSFVYKIQTENKGTVIAKAFRLDEFIPPEGKLEWIEEQLEKHHIPFAKTYKIDRSSDIFPHGYMIQEFIEGKSGFDLIMSDEMSFEEYFNKLATLLQKVHQIPVDGYGAIKNGKGEYKTFYESKLNFIKSLRERMKDLDVDKSVHEAALKAVEELKKYEHLFSPVLVHGDPPPGNGIITKDGELILIDWDNAGSGIWITEYAGLTYKGAYMWQCKLSEEERNEIIKRSFKNYYKGVNFDDPDLLEVVRLLQILTAYHSLVVHYFQHEDIKLYEIAKKRLDTILSS
ncbi:MAG: aminoglycoside phosphotransferase family protein [Candidatus Daviesbacteria bacterium]|nr:MAG: aminoglycoside phosphotransferase family protein [Candidatus Daviesbacteria bacterium]